MSRIYWTLLLICQLPHHGSLQGKRVEFMFNKRELNYGDVEHRLVLGIFAHRLPGGTRSFSRAEATGFHCYPIC
jgi:hypothetical protein